MRAKREYRDRAETEVAILDALVDRVDDGMTVFELRADVEVDIDELESALATLNDDGLISVESNPSQTVIKPADRVVPDVPTDEEETQTIGEWLRERLPF
ncbi:DUF6432 family protein [Natronorubrum daqingense]|uniref:MarR family transcriptional regulator n=1 Tax=Natronorubrum daqingense TaxID=588898 RepID=A0A1N7AII2_9EURY|nr:DUF6432 family protein [Natronorubrum daqingense]APX97968.1 MarR family transcriptional regulator [Natronorubrum daqingense]SIR38876.1 hypothetical protein SAMN05421809_1184 [Natronorubrum daqingense]